MVEYSNEIIERILKIEEFNLEEINLNKIKLVPMHEYKISSKEKPLLLVQNLQVCISLYAYSNNFAFASHLNPLIILEDEFKCDQNRNIIYSRRIEDLYNAIIESDIKGPFYIGVSVGFNPVEKTYQAIDILNKGINNLIFKLNNKGIIVKQLDLKNNHVFILDSEKAKIITPSNQNIKKLKLNY